MIKKLIILLVPIMLFSCGKVGKAPDAGDSLSVKLLTVDPGHFHAALVQKQMYENVSPDVFVYAPAGPDLQLHLDRIKSYNDRSDSPASWNEIVYTGEDFFGKMLGERKGNVVVLSGNNRKKAEYIIRSVEVGLNVLADKPMIIRYDDFEGLKAAFKTAEEKNVLLYDIMTERYEITTILQKLLSQKPEIFGTLLKGSESDPSVTKISVHHFSKMVSGAPLKRPGWFFDAEQQGEGIVDVTTHLVDLVQWECFPEQILSPSDVEIISSRKWPTAVTRADFETITGYPDYPEYLNKYISNGTLGVVANGEIIYKLKDVFAKVSVEWHVMPPQGGGDTHFSVMKGTGCDLVIRQGEKEGFVPSLYVENVKTDASQFLLKLTDALQELPYDSLSVSEAGKGVFKIEIPHKYRITHEDHFGQVMSKFLEYLDKGKMPEWEVPGMITKYYTTTMASKMAVK